MSSLSSMKKEGEVLKVELKPKPEPEVQNDKPEQEIEIGEELEFELQYDEPGEGDGLDEEIGRRPDIDFRLEIPHFELEIEPDFELDIGPNFGIQIEPDFEIELDPEELIEIEELEEDILNEMEELEEPVEEIEMEEFQGPYDGQPREELEEQIEEENSEGGSSEQMPRRRRRRMRRHVPLSTKIHTYLVLLVFFTGFFLIIAAAPPIFVWLHLTAVGCFPNICFVSWVYGVLLVLYYARGIWYLCKCRSIQLMYTYGIFWHLAFCVYLAEGLVSDNILPTFGFTVLGYAAFCVGYITLLSMTSMIKRHVVPNVR